LHCVITGKSLGQFAVFEPRRYDEARRLEPLLQELAPQLDLFTHINGGGRVRRQTYQESVGFADLVVDFPLPLFASSELEVDERIEAFLPEPFMDAEGFVPVR